jgi:hypothetical protein
VDALPLSSHHQARLSLPPGYDRPVQPSQRRHALPITESWLTAWNRRHENPPEILYHYTDAKALYSIVDENNTWATDAHHLNDTSELSYVDEVIHSVLATLIGAHHGRPSRSFLEAADMELLDNLRKEWDIYITSFCTCGDQLSQWRGYSRTGGGYSIGFRAKDMLPSVPSSLLRLRCVIYERSEQEKLVCEIFQGLCCWLESLSSSQSNELVCTHALLEAARMLSECLFCLKNPGFSEEREWRLVHIVQAKLHLSHTPLHFRPTPAGLVPYVKLTPNGQQPGVRGLLPIDEVVVGPNPHPEEARNAMQCFLAHSCGGATVKVRNSTIPLRV